MERLPLTEWRPDSSTAPGCRTCTPDSDNFTGGWTMAVDREYRRLWVGGFFTQVCGESGTPCIKQHSVGRFAL